MESAGINLYAYCGNNPINSTDPSGRNAYLVNGGGYTGHTAIVFDNSDGGVTAYHFYAQSHTGNNPSGDIKAMFYDQAHIWSQDFNSLGDLFISMNKDYGSVTLKAMAIGTPAD